MAHLNALLELANSISFVVASVLLFVLFAHMRNLTIERRKHGVSKRMIEIDMRALLLSMVAISIWLTIDMTGVVITRATVWYWRRFGVGGGGGPMNVTQTEAMLFAAILMVIGTIGITYVISHRTLGNWPWMLSASGVVATIALFFVQH